MLSNPSTWSKRRIITVTLLFVAVVTVIVTVGLVDPSHCTWMPKCIFKLTTGYDCPGCGATRALHAMLHGHIAEAVAYNYFLVIGVVYVALVIIAGFVVSPNNKRFRSIVLGRTAGYTYVALFFIWWIVRNLPLYKSLL